MTVITESWYSHVIENGFIRLWCHDCGGEVRFRDVPAGHAKAAEMIAVHKPSGCCDERQQNAGARS